MCYNPQFITIKRKNPDGVVWLDGKRYVPCGNCVQCISQKSLEWAYRCMEEAKQHKDNCFITLTYNDMFLPSGGTLVRKDLTDFIKRLRKYLEPVRIRVFYSGEYGRRGKRPHYHLIVFGWSPKDRFFWQYDKSGSILYRSPTIEKLWRADYYDPDSFAHSRVSMGFSSVGDLTFESAKYCAKYLQKLQPPPEGCLPAFVGQSNRPGLGFASIKPEILLDGGIFLNGKSIPVPRYFMKKLEEGHDLLQYKDRKYYAWLNRHLIEDPHFVLTRKKLKLFTEKLLTKK